jgi:alkylhydroperoxidase family enzyme
MGLTEEETNELATYKDSEKFTELEKAAIEYAEYLTRTPANVPDEVFERLRSHLDERQLVELTATIAWENFIGRFNRGFDVQPQGYAEKSYFTPEI